MSFTISIGKKYLKILIILFTLLLLSVFIDLFSLKPQQNDIKSDFNQQNKPLIEVLDKSYDNFVFNDFNSNNKSGFDTTLVPNVVHYVVFDNHYMDFNHFLSIKSVLKQQKPLKIIIHCNCDQMKGKYWQQLMSSADNRTISVRRVAKPEFIFGKKLSSVYHSSDIARIEIMKTFGGIFIDNDVFVVKCLDYFRKFEFSIGWPTHENIGLAVNNPLIISPLFYIHYNRIGTQVLIGHKNARFPALWYDSYRKYRPLRWYYNAGQLPTNDILAKHPSLVHRVEYEFGVHNLVPMLYNDLYPFWEKNFYTIHLLSRHKSYLVADDKTPYFDPQNIKTYNKTFGQMARLVLYNQKDIIND